MPRFSTEHFKSITLAFLGLLAGVAWLYVMYNEHRSREPIGVVRKRFVFYPEYSHGIWQEGKCPAEGELTCREVTYKIALSGCGNVTLHWHVLSGEDVDANSTYIGANPRIDESRYPLYAVLNEDSRLIDSPALGQPMPQSCQLK